MNEQLANTLSSILANATPLLIAGLAETITERVGVINLSLDGSLQIAAMAAFVTAYLTGNILAGLAAGILVALLVALLIVVANIELKQDQVAVGFVLTLLLGNLAQFLGQNYTRLPGPLFPIWPIPYLSDIPFVGKIFFRQNVLVYFSFILIFVTWFVFYRTRWGLSLRAVGERPPAAFSRGTNVNQIRYIYTIIGGALIGIAGASYSLAIKSGWANPPVMRGDGWIALAIVIFGGWHPFRVAFGAYLFTALRALASTIQQTTDFPLVLVNMVPWILMILTLLMVSSGFVERVMQVSPPWAQRLLRNVLRSKPPVALGTRFTRE